MTTGARALGRVIDETRSLFHHLRRAAEVVHAEETLGGGERSVLVDLARGGPRTVPELARARPVSRQHIQTIVNPLVERGLLTFAPNPRHQRSKLVALTTSGRALVARIDRREAVVLAAVARGFRAADLETAADTLRRVREALAPVIGNAGQREGRSS